MRTNRTARLRGALVVGLLAPLLGAVSTPARAAGITYISFEDIPAVCLSSEAVPLRGRYAAAKFKGPSADDGAAVFDACAGWGIPPRTGSRVLAVTGFELANGGTASAPVRISFPARQKKVTMWVSQGGGNVGEAVFKMVARRAGKAITSTTSATSTSAWVELTVRHKKGVDAVTITAPTEPDGIWIMDDLTMVG